MKQEKESVKINYSINPISKDYFFLTLTERALIKWTLMDWHLQNYIQKMWIPETILNDVAESIVLVESMNDVELIENLALREMMVGGGEWQEDNPQDGSMILAIRSEIYDLFKSGRTKNTEIFFKQQNWSYEGQFIKRLEF